MKPIEFLKRVWFRAAVKDHPDSQAPSASTQNKKHYEGSASLPQ